MFGAENGGILPDNSLQGTCGICGEPATTGLLGISLPLPEGLPLGKPHKCKGCGLIICGKHFSASRQKCVRCETGKDSWCKTPGMPGQS
jgi:hypothetical protein